MAFKLFGFRFGRDTAEEESKTKTFVPPSNDDAALVIDATPYTNIYHKYIYDTQGIINDEVSLIKKYREMSISPDVETAIDEIVNDLVIVDQQEPPVQIVIGDNLKMSEDIKDKIYNEFQNVLRLLNFQDNAYDIIRRWYVDARLYYQILIDESNPSRGIRELRYIDPRCIKKVKENKVEKDENGIDKVVSTKEYYIYNKDGLEVREANTNQGVKITNDSIIFCHSGLVNEDSTMILSYLHKAIKPYNNLRAMEDALVIYRITRAPERRIFNIDIGDMPPNKAKQYIQDIMTNYRNKLVYNPATGEMRDDRRHATILEDFWFPKRGERNSEVTTLPGGQNLSEISDIEYFQKKLYRALSIPVTRLDPTTGFNMGRTAEISREEVKFSKFITRLRHRFSRLFDDILMKQLVLKKITTPEDWDIIKENIYYNFLSDSHFAELKETEILKERLDLVDQADQYVGKYFSPTYVKEKILRQSEQDIEEISKENGQGEGTPEEGGEEAPPAEGETGGEEEMPDLGGPEVGGSEPTPEEVPPEPEEET